MDILAHTLWANILARKAKKTGESKKKFNINVGWTAFWGIFPDLFAFTIPVIFAFYNLVFKQASLSKIGHHNVIANFNIVSYLYQFSHSLVIFLLVFILVWIISKRPRYELLGWLLHILIDIPSHSISFFPTPFLFPISDYRFPYGVYWGNQWYMIINYSLLLIIWGRILFKKYSFQISHKK